VEIKNGKKVMSSARTTRATCSWRWTLNQETIHTINGIQGVIKFVGTAGCPMPRGRIRRSEPAARCRRSDQEEEPTRRSVPRGAGVEITEGRSQTSVKRCRKCCRTRAKVRVSWRLLVGHFGGARLLQLKAH